MAKRRFSVGTHAFAVVLSVWLARDAQAVVLYSENWEGGTNGQSIHAAPFSYTNESGGPNNSISINDQTPLGGLAVDGKSQTFGLGVSVKPVTGPSASPGTIYTLSAELYGYPSLNDSWIGLNNSAKGDFNNCGAYLGLAAPNGAGFWRFDARGVRNNAVEDIFDFPVGQLMQAQITATIVLDISANSVTANLTDGVTTLTHTFDDDNNNFTGIDRFAIQQRFGGLSIDEVTIEQSAPTAPIPGDFDGDTDVDGADLEIWRTNMGTTSGATTSVGDADLDADVDGHDFLIWQRNVMVTPIVSVPEPTTGVIAISASLAMTHFSRSVARRGRGRG